MAGLKNTRPVIHFENRDLLGVLRQPNWQFWSEVAKFFDPSPTDWDNYQARELGYVFEYIDARMVILLNKIPFFFVRLSQRLSNLLCHSKLCRSVFHCKGIASHVSADNHVWF